ncbi:NB-ARC domain-containing protein [Forsythia ovata]|uniref:NB-ARC domain-containing protein n=1 Tax=Forsythia ovata TaxID=205694 RepID=A0ABD1WNM9_9LAMI
MAVGGQIGGNNQVVNDNDLNTSPIDVGRQNNDLPSTHPQALVPSDVDVGGQINDLPRLIEKQEQKSLEDVAQKYLMDLIGRSLILIAKIKSDSQVKACNMHDLYIV